MTSHRRKTTKQLYEKLGASHSVNQRRIRNTDSPLFFCAEGDSNISRTMVLSKFRR